jgi:hypothetical protein
VGKKEDDEDARIERIFKKLRRRKDVIRVGNVYVDVPGALERQVACSDGLCMAHGRGRKLAGKTCCTTFRVPIETEDVEKIAKIVDQVSEIRDVGKAIERAEGWWKIEEDQAWLETRPSGACVFLSAPKGDRPWCTIHEWALKNGEEFRVHKPETCCLFPLYLLENGDEVLVTSYGSDLFKKADPDEADDIRRFDCLHPPKGQGRSLLVEQDDELRYRLGEKRWQRVLKRLRKLGYAV